MRIRVILGSAMIVFLALCFAVDALLNTRWVVSVLIVCIGMLSWCELAALSGVAARPRGGSWPLFAVGLAATLFFLSSPLWRSETTGPAETPLGTGIAVLLPLAFLTVVFRKDHREGFLPLLVTVLGPLLCGFLLSYLLKIYLLPRGTLLGAVFLLGIKGNDIAAYFVGKTLGRTHFLPVSPKKTLEGTTGALLFSSIWFAAAGAIWPEPLFPWPQGALFGIILSVASQLGDLSESLLKRYFLVKDSAVLLPEFGGLLDMVDSFLYCGFVFWLLV